MAMTREQNNARGRKYYYAHREEIRARARLYYKANRAKKLAYQKQYDDRTWEPGQDSERVRVYYEKNKEKRKQYDRSEKRITRRAERLYGITKEKYLSLLVSQSNSCAVCKSKDWNGKSRHVDHDHKSGKVRAILCWRCNQALGLIKDDPNIAMAMGRFLIAHGFSLYQAEVA